MSGGVKACFRQREQCTVYKGQESRGSIGTEGHPLGRGVSRDEDEKPVEGRPQKTL